MDDTPVINDHLNQSALLRVNNQNAFPTEQKSVGASVPRITLDITGLLKVGFLIFAIWLLAKTQGVTPAKKTELVSPIVIVPQITSLDVEPLIVIASIKPPIPEVKPVPVEPKPTKVTEIYITPELLGPPAFDVVDD